MAKSPEESKYTAQLTLFPNDTQRNEETIYLASPAATLDQAIGGRTMQPGAGNRLHSGRRQEHRVQRFFGRREILALFGDYKPLTGDVPTNYYMPLGWLRPSCGPWQLRANQT
jgi:hypothetical protein